MGKNFLLEALGWYGAVAIIAAYGLVSFSNIGANSLWFQLLNATGAIGIIVVSYRKGVMQSVWLNAFWLAIALVALGSMFVGR